MTDNNRLRHLFERFKTGTATLMEKQELAELVKTLDDETLSGHLKQAWETQDKTEPVFSQLEAEYMLQQILGKKVAPATVIPIYKRRVFKIAVAASLLLAVTTTVVLTLGNNNKEKITETIPAEKDIPAPHDTKASITLANGQKIILANIGNGMIASQGDVQLTKTGDGQIVYSGSAREDLYNTLTNPRGSTAVNLTLQDGTRVWLNAESSLTYPAAFKGAERKVSITGEAYFEVAKNTSMPFKVSKGQTEVTVLGTHFNVNAYDDENEIEVTLLEGSVKVNNGNANALLRPGQQAQISTEIEVLDNVNIEKVVAWKEGWFDFDKTELSTIMRQIGRWYDVDIIYEGPLKPEIFGGRISNRLPMSSILELLKKIGVERFRLEERKLFVKPKA